MKSTILAAALIAFSSSAEAVSQSQSCNLLKLIALEMNVVASNIVNADTTRVPEGGPYRLKRFRCDVGNCEIESVLQIKEVYDPEHLDSKDSGYVSYPDINVGDQKADMRRLAHDYDMAARACFK